MNEELNVIKPPISQKQEQKQIPFFPESIFGNPKTNAERKEIMKTIKKELEEKENYKPELTIYERAELGKQLIEATKNDDLKKVKDLIKKGADLNVQNGFGNTALICSSDNNNHEIINLLVQNGANVNIKNIKNKTALDILSTKLFFNTTSHYNNLYSDIKLILEKSDHVPIELHTQLLSLLRFESEYPYVVDIIKLAIQKGADVNLRNENIGKTALFEAVKANDINFTKFLLDHGARIDIQDGAGKNAVSYISSIVMNSLFIDRQLITFHG